LAEKDGEFRNAINGSHLSLPDGVGMKTALRILGRPLTNPVPGGRRLVRPLCAFAADNGWRVVLFGGSTGVAFDAANQLRRTIPGLEIQGIDPGLIDLDGQVEAQLAEISAQLLLVGLGGPKQEKWIARRLGYLDVTAAIGVGAGFTLIGQNAEPPSWVPELGLEWIYRLIREPRRLWRRYLLGIPQFAILVAKQRLAHKSMGGLTLKKRS
jgi:N-acetylglucosaminyldiphosphoundecaprenol N-acetyl-beta-D-mannosaminyltransferase